MTDAGNVQHVVNDLLVENEILLEVRRRQIRAHVRFHQVNFEIRIDNQVESRHFEEALLVFVISRDSVQQRFLVQDRKANGVFNLVPNGLRVGSLAPHERIEARLHSKPKCVVIAGQRWNLPRRDVIVTHDVLIDVLRVERMVFLRAVAEQDVTVVDVHPQRVNRREDRVNPDVEFVSINQQRILDKLLNERQVVVQVDVLDLPDLYVTVLMVLDDKKLLWILRGVIFELIAILWQLECGGNVFELRRRQIDLVGDESAAGEVIHLLVRLHGEYFRLNFRKRVVVRP